MPAKPTYLILGKATKIIQYPYVLSVIVLIIQTFVGTSILSYVSMVFMILYWIFIMYLALLLKAMVTGTENKVLAMAWKWILLGAIAGIATIVLGQLLPVSPYTDAMLSTLGTTQDPALLLANVTPAIIAIAGMLLIYVPAQLIIPAVCSYAGWKRVEKHVFMLDDVRKRAVIDAMHKLFVAFSANCITGACIIAVLLSLVGFFENIGTPVVLVFGILILISGIATIIAAIIAFFYTALGYNATGEAFMLVEEGVGSTPGPGIDSTGTFASRCKACGNPIPEGHDISYCPICGAIIDANARKFPKE